MTTDRDEGLDEKLRALRGSMASPLELEERVIAALRERGLIGTRDRRSRFWFAAAAVVFFSVGWVARTATGPRPAAPDNRPRFLLLISQLPDSPDRPPEAKLVQEATDWVSPLRPDHKLLWADKLAPRAELIQAAAGAELPTFRPPSGFFLVRESSMGEAVALARACPLLRYGATVTVLAVDPH